MTTLTTDRCTLRRFRPDDGAALHAYLSQPEAVRFEPYDPVDRATADRLARERSSDGRFWAIARRADDSLVGNLYLAQDGPPSFRTWELGFVLNPHWWGQGIATESARALLDHVFANLGAHRVIARCNTENVRSWRLLERLRFVREAHFRSAVTFVEDADGNPIWHDDYLYASLDSDWSRGGPPFS